MPGCRPKGKFELTLPLAEVDRRCSGVGAVGASLLRFVAIKIAAALHRDGALEWFPWAILVRFGVAIF
jgi:hypothetical protein